MALTLQSEQFHFVFERKKYTHFFLGTLSLPLPSTLFAIFFPFFAMRYSALCSRPWWDGRARKAPRSATFGHVSPSLSLAESWLCVQSKLGFCGGGGQIQFEISGNLGKSFNLEQMPVWGNRWQFVSIIISESEINGSVPRASTESRICAQPKLGFSEEARSSERTQTSHFSWVRLIESQISIKKANLSFFYRLK